MKSAFRLFTVFGININLHFTFPLLILLVIPGGIKRVVLVIAIFGFVTMHELCHALMARRFGIKVHEITLLPIGGVASMSKVPDKPLQEFAVSIAGPLSNLAVIAIFYYPLKILLGAGALFHPLSTATWPLTVAYAYWINLILAIFNLLPAFPMDGGRLFRALLASRLGMLRATKIAVMVGHVFALGFAYLGLVQLNIILIAIAVFIYMAASSEELQVGVKEALKKFKVRDILPGDFLTLEKNATLSKVLEMIFHYHQEDFPVVDGARIVGFLTRQDVMAAVHNRGTAIRVDEIMRRDFPKVKETDSLMKVQDIMQEWRIRALPVMRGDRVAGVVTLEDIGRVYAMKSNM